MVIKYRVFCPKGMISSYPKAKKRPSRRKTWAHGIDKDLWYRHRLMVWKWTYGIDMDSWYRHELMV